MEAGRDGTSQGGDGWGWGLCVAPTRGCPDHPHPTSKQERGEDALYQRESKEAAVWVPQCHQAPLGMVGGQEHLSLASLWALDAAWHHVIANPGCTLASCHCDPSNVSLWSLDTSQHHITTVPGCIPAPWNHGPWMHPSTLSLPCQHCITSVPGSTRALYHSNSWIHPDTFSP